MVIVSLSSTAHTTDRLPWLSTRLVAESSGSKLDFRSICHPARCVPVSDVRMPGSCAGG